MLSFKGCPAQQKTLGLDVTIFLPQLALLRVPICTWQGYTHISNLKVLPHKEVERGTGMGAYSANTTATVTQES